MTRGSVRRDNAPWLADRLTDHWPSLSAEIQLRTYSGQLMISAPAISNACEEPDRRAIDEGDVLQIENDPAGRRRREQFLQLRHMLAVQHATQNEDAAVGLLGVVDSVGHVRAPGSLIRVLIAVNTRPEGARRGPNVNGWFY